MRDYLASAKPVELADSDPLGINKTAFSDPLAVDSVCIVMESESMPDESMDVSTVPFTSLLENHPCRMRVPVLAAVSISKVARERVGKPRYGLARNTEVETLVELLVCDALPLPKTLLKIGFSTKSR